MSGPQFVEGAANDLRPHKRAGRHDQDRGVGQAQPLGGDHAAKVGLVANHDIWTPIGAQRQHIWHTPGGGASDEAIPELLVFAGHIDWAKR